MNPLPVCVVGAGVSGLAAAKALGDAGVPWAGLEKGSGVGGLWRYGNDNGLSGIYASLRTNTSKHATEFADFPMPRDTPDFPGHAQMAAYLDGYADRFGLRGSFRFRTGAATAAPAGDGTWEVSTDDGARGRYRAVVAASGHHWKPVRGTFPGAFDGRQLHTHEYRSPEGFEGRRVLVVGIGNSAVDIACELAAVAASIVLSTRRGAHVLPKRLLGRPIDRWGGWPGTLLPAAVQGAIVGTLVSLARGSLKSFGLPVPRHALHEAHPTLSDDLPRLVRDGRIRVKPDVAALEGGSVRFSDGTRDAFDVLIHATGYELALPFLERSIADPETLEGTLYRSVVPVDRPGLYFVGFVQPQQGSIARLAELQARWVAGLVAGTHGLPPREAMELEIRERLAWRARRVVASRRHSMEVDYWAARRDLIRELRRARTNFSTAPRPPG